MNTKSYRQELNELLNSYTGSYSMKRIAKELDNRDAADVVGELSYLLELFKKKMKEQ